MVIIPNRKSAERIKHDMARLTAQAAPDDVSHLMDQYRNKRATNPKHQVREAKSFHPIPSHKSAEDPEHRMDSDRYAEHPPAQIKRRTSRFQEHAMILSGADHFSERLYDDSSFSSCKWDGSREIE